MYIKILGPNCKKCSKVYDLVNEIIDDLDVSAVIEKITELKDIVEYGVMRTPTIVINEDILFVGMVPSKKNLLKEIKNRI